MKKLIAMLIISAFFTGCVFWPALEFEEKHFKIARTEWEAQDIENYIVLQEFFNGAAWTKGLIAIENNVIVDFVCHCHNTFPDYFCNGINNMKTISDLFDWINERYKEADKKTRLNSYMITLDVIYNEEYHYPEYIYYNRKRKMKLKTGDGYGSIKFRLSDFTPVYPEFN